MTKNDEQKMVIFGYAVLNFAQNSFTQNRTRRSIKKQKVWQNFHTQAATLFKTTFAMISHSSSPIQKQRLKQKARFTVPGVRRGVEPRFVRRQEHVSVQSMPTDAAPQEAKLVYDLTHDDFCVQIKGDGRELIDLTEYD